MRKLSLRLVTVAFFLGALTFSISSKTSTGHVQLFQSANAQGLYFQLYAFPCGSGGSQFICGPGGNPYCTNVPCGHSN